MDITISTADLRSALHRVQGIVKAKGTMPILGCVLLEASITPAGGRLSVKATDLELGSSSSHACEVKKEGVVAVPGKALHDIAKALPETSCRLKLGTGCRLEVTSGASTFRLAGLPGEDFPALGLVEPGTSAQVSGVLREALDAVAYAMSTDETRYNLNGVFFDQDKEGLTLVATDGHRLAMRHVPGLLVPGLNGGVIVGGAAVRQLCKLMNEEGTGELAVEKNSLIYQRAGVRFAARLVDGQFPDYRQVVPSDFVAQATLNKRATSEALSRVLLLSDRGSAVTMKINGDKLELSTRNPDMGDCSDSVPATYSGNEIKINLNGSYVLEMLGSMSAEDVALHFGDETSPVVAKGNENDPVAVLMPMRG